MKRLVCLLLVVSIACPGCAKKKKGTTAVVTHLLDKVPYGAWDNVTQLKRENAYLRLELSRTRSMGYMPVQGPRLDRLETVLLDRISELEDNIEAQWNAVDSAEVAIEAQRVTIEVLQKLCRLYEDVLDSQRETIELLKKICRLYEDEVDGL